MISLYCVFGGLVFSLVENEARAKKLEQKEFEDGEMMKNVTEVIHTTIHGGHCVS